MNDEYEYDEDSDDSDEQEDSELEKEFKFQCEEVGKLIQDKVFEAAKALREAVKIAEEHGIPFESHVSFLNNNYVPESFSDSKWNKIDRSRVQEITNIYGEYVGDLFYSGGWEHSACC